MINQIEIPSIRIKKPNTIKIIDKIFWIIIPYLTHLARVTDFI